MGIMKRSLFHTWRRAASSLTKETGDISSVFPSLSGKKPDPLSPRFSDLKKSLVGGNEEAVTASWQRLLVSLKDEVQKIKSQGSKVIPDIEYQDIISGRLTQTQFNSIRHRGAVVIRNVLSRQQASDLKVQAQEYISANKSKVRAFPPDDPAVYELYWTPTQVYARAHPNMLKTQSFLSSLWHSSDPNSEISTTYPLTYADRFRIRKPGDGKFALGPHTDGGSLERWEDPEYSKVYSRILSGQWESYDPFDARHRISANMDLYNGLGSCSMFRLFQGWLSMSSTGPGEGTLKVCPLLQHATSYLMLRPFFHFATNEEEQIEMNLDSTFPNSVPGAGQEYNPETHPDLQLESTMVSLPKVEPGDYVAWHCDSIHAVDQKHQGNGDSSVLYIPACAMTTNNNNFLKRQRMAALKYSPPPDFPGAGGDGEIGFQGALNWNSLNEDGKRAMGLGSKKWELKNGMSRGERQIIEEGNKLLFA